MSQTKQQFTPDQILEAGRRAEAQGHTDYAMQFYRHLTEHHPLSAEATLAREALGRLTLRQAAGETKMNGHHRNGATSWSADAARDATPREVPVTREPVAARAAPAGSPSTGPEAPRTAPETRREFRPRASDIAARQPLALPAPVRGYVIGRALAMLVAGLGFLLVGLGIAIVVLLVSMGGVPLLPPLVPPPLLAVGLIVLGFVLVLAGQMALASFATANASRETAAMLRAIADELVRYR